MKTAEFDLYGCGLYFITDSRLTKQNIFEDALQALKAGVRIVQYREKEKSTKEMVNDAQKLRRLTAERNTFLIVNDRVDVALSCNADGVHLGKDDMPLASARKILGKEKIIGVTVHSIDEAKKAEKEGADYVALSPIFETKTKKDAGPGKGVDFILEAKKNIKIPFTCVGGINQQNMDIVVKAGAKSAALISAVVASDDVFLACKGFIKIFRQNDSD